MNKSWQVVRTRIGFVGDGFSTLAGTSKPAFELAEELAKRNIEVIIITSNPNSAHIDVHNGAVSKMALDGVKITVLPSLFRSLLLKPNHYRSVILKQLLKCDVVHGYDYISLHAIDNLLGKDRSRIPLVYSCTGCYKLRPKDITNVRAKGWLNFTNPHFIFKSLCPDVVFERIFNDFDVIVSRSDYITRQLMEDGVGNSKIKRIPVGMKTGIYAALAEHRPQAHTRYDFLYFGWGSALRGVPQLLEAFDIVKKERKGAKLGIFFLGSHEIEERAYASEIRKRKDFKSQVELEIGPKEHIPELIMSTNAIVLPFQSPFGYAHPPLTILESMLLRRTVVSTNVGSIPEIITSGKTGILVEPNEVEGLAASMCSTFDDRLRSQIGERAQYEITKNHRIEDTTIRMISTYENAISDK